MDLTGPGAYIKAVHLVATEDIADLSVYGIGAAFNSNASSGSPVLSLAGSASAGDNILVARTPGATQTIVDSYLNASNTFDDIQIFNGTFPLFNGDDRVELYFNVLSQRFTV